MRKYKFEAAHFHVLKYIAIIVVVIFGIKMFIYHRSNTTVNIPRFQNGKYEKIYQTTYGHSVLGNTHVLSVPGMILLTNDEYEVEIIKACLSSAGLLDRNMHLNPATKDEIELFYEAYVMYGGNKIKKEDLIKER